MRALAGTILVEPVYDHGGRVPPGTPYHASGIDIPGHIVYGLVIAATGENPESQQGVVVASAIDEFSPGMVALYMPYHGERIRLKGKEYLCIPDRELVGWLDGDRVQPRKGWLLIQPEWPSDKTESSLLYLPGHSGLHDPVLLGRVLRQGAFTTLIVGTRVVMQPDVGFEIGMASVGENLYLLSEQHILATIEDNAKDTIE